MELSSSASGYLTVDRFKVYLYNLGTYTFSQSSTAPEGFSNSFKVDCTTADASPAATGYFLLRYVMEGQDLQHLQKGTSNALPVTLSFWVKSNVTGTYVISLYDHDNSGRTVSKQYTISSADTWEHKTLTYPADTTGAFTNDNGLSLQITIWLAGGSNYTSGTLNETWNSYVAANEAVGQTNLASAVNNYWQVTGVQLELGDKATPFEHRSYGEELALCQRYYWRAVTDLAARRWGIGYGVSGNNTVRAIVPFPTEMRSAPTSLETTGVATDYSVVTGTTIIACSSVVTLGSATTFTSDIIFTAGSAIGNGFCYQVRSATNGAYLAWSAEL